jgi:hypothetical protein
MKIYRTTVLLLLFCMAVKSGISHYGKDIVWVFKNRVLLGRYLGQKKKKQNAREICIRSFMISARHQILFG